MRSHLDCAVGDVCFPSATARKSESDVNGVAAGLRQISVECVQLLQSFPNSIAWFRTKACRFSVVNQIYVKEVPSEVDGEGV